MDKANVDIVIDNVQEELAKIAESGLNQSNFETAYKLSDMLFKLSEVKCMSTIKKSLYEAYMDSKRTYRMIKTQDNFKTVMDCVCNYMTELSDTVKDMLKDSDCMEEREIISKYIDSMR